MGMEGLIVFGIKMDYMYVVFFVLLFSIDVINFGGSLEVKLLRIVFFVYFFGIYLGVLVLFLLVVIF